MGKNTTHGFFYKPDYGEKGPAADLKYNAALDTTDAIIYSAYQGIVALNTLVTGWVPMENQDILVPGCTYSSASQFTVSGDLTAQFAANAKVRVDLGSGTLKGSYVASSSYAGGATTVILHDSILTSPLSGVWVTATRNGLYPYGPGYVVARDYGVPGTTAFDAALAAIGASARTLVLTPGTWGPPTSAVPANVNLRVESGATIAVGNGQTLTINGPLEAGLYQIFSCTGTGKVLLGAGAVSAAIPHWWRDPSVTDWTNAIQAAIQSVPDRTTGSTSTGRGRVFIPAGEYKCNFVVDRPNITIDGAGPGVTIFDSYDPTKAVITVGNAGVSTVEYCSINHFSIGRRGLNVLATCGIRIDGGYECNFTDFSIYGVVGDGIWLYTVGSEENYFNHFNNFAIDWCTGAAIRDQFDAGTDNSSGGSYFCNGIIHSQSYPDTNHPTWGPSYTIWTSGSTRISNIWFQGHDGHGFFMSGSTPLIVASNCDCDGVGGVAMEFDTPLAYPLTSYIQGHLGLGGNVKLSNGTIVTAPWGSPVNWIVGAVIQDPYISGMLRIPDSMDANYNSGGPWTGTYASIYNHYGYLYFDSPTGGIRLKQNPQVEQATGAGINLKSTTAGKTVSIANNVGNLILTPSSGFATVIVGVVEYANNAAALTAGLTAGMVYRTGDALMIVH